MWIRYWKMSRFLLKLSWGSLILISLMCFPIKSGTTSSQERLGSGIVDKYRSRRNSRSFCEPIKIAVCSDMSYNETFFPNLLNHESQTEAAFEIHKYSALIKVKCSPKLREFLCALFTPVCDTLNYDQVLAPCSSLCEQVRGECEHVFQAFGIPWPEDCSRFPGSGEICIGGPSLSQINSPSRQTPQSDSVISEDNKNGPLDYDSPELKSTSAQGNLFNLRLAPTTSSTSLTSRNISNSSFFEVRRLECPSDWYHPGHFIGELEDCGATCNSIFSNDEKFIASLIVSILATATLLVSLLTIITIFIDPMRFQQYPERTILHQAICYAALGLGYLIPALWGSELGCSEGFIIQGPGFASCTLLFMFVYFFTFGAHIWSTLMSFTFFLSAHLKWGEEAISEYRILFHSISWGFSFLSTIILVALGKIEGDPLLGLCSLGFQRPVQLRYFMIYPLFLLMTVGLVCGTKGLVALMRIRRELKKSSNISSISAGMRNGNGRGGGGQRGGVNGSDLNLGNGLLWDNLSSIDSSSKSEGSRRLEYFMIRIAIYSTLYLITTGLFTITLVQISLTSWPLGVIAPILNHHLKYNNPSQKFFIVLILRYISNLIFGLCLSVWIFNRKTWYSWRRFFCGK